MTREAQPSPPGDIEAVVRILAGRVDPALSGADVERLRARLIERPEGDGAPAGAARWTDAVIEAEIPARAFVLDLGCGRGELLERLIRDKGARGQGVELDPEAVIACAERGVPVLEIDLDERLKDFPSGRFDYVVLEETLQTLRRPLHILDEMLRVGRHGIVSFPNFAYWRVRLQLALEGRMPVTPRLPFRWHDTPNIHLFSIQDFLDWAASAGVRVSRAFALSEGETRPLRPDDNLFAEEALFLVTRG